MKKNLILCFLTTIFLELTLFNYNHYSTIFTNKTAIITGDQSLANGESLEFNSFNSRITSIYIEPVFLKEQKEMYAKVTWIDEESSNRFVYAKIVKGLDFSNYISISPLGNVENLKIDFSPANVIIKSVELNKTVPFVFMPLRILLIFAILVFFISIKHIQTREKILYFLFEYKFDIANKKQNLSLILLIFAIICFNFIAAYSIFGFKDVHPGLEQYNNLANALLKGQFHLDIEPPQKLKDAQKPYDWTYRQNNNIFPLWSYTNDNYKNNLDTNFNEKYLWDHSFYKGKYYCYFGVVPAVILFLPFQVITGNYLPTSFAVFLFASIVTLLLFLIWRKIIAIYLKNMPHFFFLIGGTTLYACSLITKLLFFPRFYEVSQASGLMFILIGLLFLIGDKKNIFAGSLCFALAVGCRPNMIFFSLLVPILLWDKMNVKIAIRVIIPYILVAIPLMLYNYYRFDSAFEFGQNYILTGTNAGKWIANDLVGKFSLLFNGFLSYIFNPPNFDITFPFLTTKISNITKSELNPFVLKSEVFGFISFPIMCFLFTLKLVKNKLLKKVILIGFIIVFMNITIFSLTAIQIRYMVDFIWLIALSALICAYFTYQRFQDNLVLKNVILSAFYISCFICIIMVFFMNFTTEMNMLKENNPAFWYYFARNFGVINGI